MTNRIPSLNQEQRQQLLISSIRDYAIYLLDAEGRVSSWNAGAERFKGYQADEIVGQHFSRFHTPEDQARGVPARALQTARTEGKFECEGWRVRKDGTRFWASVVIDPVFDGTELIGFAKITRDITEQKAARDALHASEQHFRLLVQGVVDYAIYMLSPTGEVSNWNAGAERIKGYCAAEVIGSHFSRFYTEPDRAAGMPALALATAERSGKYESEGWRVRKDGSRFWAHVVVDPIRDDSGTLLGFAKITRDVTEQREAAQSLEQTRAALFQSQKMEAIGQLTGGIAHDFNNLLSVVASGLEIIKAQGGGGVDRRVIDSMNRAIERGASLTQQLLAFARQQPLAPEIHNINKLIEGFESVLRRAVDSSVDFQCRLAAGLPNACIDEARFETAILNLVVNARDAMPDGGRLLLETRAVTLDSHNSLAPGDYVEVIVIDSGMGMPPDVAARVFEPFFTTKPVGKGTGLGLAQVHGFLVQSGGDITVESTPGKGTTFRILLPASAGLEGKAPAAGSGREKVLVVEDEEDLALLAATLFESLGYEVLIANNGKDALSMLERNPDVDVVFSDVMMPHMSGIELARIVRRAYPAARIVLASGYPVPALLEQQGDIDEFPFVSKPYRLPEIIKRLR
ncbi:PAS domain S-box protein [Massilia sp. GCM10020059]|uniref:histidine kinase n=1 Tax=Massilia agrisoli TaxID=2892444 RepID=A0ABS8IVQ8_9BURK|nr:PAS domain-containing sensor histidine kinase [Massilia agrisoli]MCC6072629.1 PAS domain S-box protein [Massilia agrisoli]